MIRICSCIGGSASTLELPKHLEVAQSCKTCGGKLSVDGRGALSGNMLSTVGLELSRAIDPYLNWKTASKGKQRAVRRARSRTSFTWDIKKKCTPKNSEESQDLADRDSKRTGDMPVSESEKLGVSILGRRFSDTLESVPIKKRRFPLVRSPSPPPQSPYHMDETDHSQERQSASYQESASNAQQVLKINSGIKTSICHERILADENTNFEVNEELCATADFSGISILAAAACDSSVGGDIVSTAAPLSEGHSFRGEELLEISKSAESQFLSEENEKKLVNSSEDLTAKINIAPEISTSLVLPSKGLDGNKIDGSHLLEESKSSLHNVPDKVRGAEFTSRDDKFPWDLNTVMDVCESPCDEEVVNSEPFAANVFADDGIRDGKPGSEESCHGQTELGDSKYPPKFVDCTVHFDGVPKDSCALAESKLEVTTDSCCHSSLSDYTDGNKFFSFPHGDDSSQEQNPLEDAPVALEFAEAINPSNNQERGSLIAEDGSSPVEVAVGPLERSPLDASALEEEKADIHHKSFGFMVETKTSSCHMGLSENATINHTTHPNEPHHEVDQIANKIVSEENTHVATAAVLNNCLDNSCLTDVPMVEAIHCRSPQADKPGPLHADSAAGKIDQSSTVSHVDEASDVLVDGNVCKNMTADGVSGKILRTDELDGTAHRQVDHSNDVDMSPCLADTSRGSSNHDECEDKTTAAVVKVEDNKCSALADKNSSTTKTDYPVHVGSKVSMCNSEGMMPGMADAVPLGADLSSHGAYKSYVDGHIKIPVEVALDDFDYDYDSDASQIDTDQACGMEKIELLGDDDSQYEDGEFRGSLMNSWGEDDAEEGEMEHVDYGSDTRETDDYEVASEFPTSVSLHVDNVECKNDKLSGVGHVHHDGVQCGKKDAQDAVSQPFVQGSMTADVSDAGSGKRSVGSVVRKVLRGHLGGKDESKKLERSVKDAQLSGAGNDKICDDVRESSNLASLRLKSSGWDQLPEGSRSSGDGVLDSGIDASDLDHTCVPLDASSAGGSLRKVVNSTLRRDSSSRVERPKSSDMSCRKDKAYVRASRSDDPADLNPRVERDTGTRAIGRGGSSLHMHGRGRGRGRGDHLVDSSNRWGSSRHNSPGYYSPACFTHPGSKNAATAAAAKVECNGFVVAPDGTLVKASGGGPAGRMPRRSANASSRSTHRSIPRRGSPVERDGAFGMPLGLANTREMSPDRHIIIGQGRAGRYGPRMVSTAHRERYHGSDVDSSLPVHHPLSRRDRSFSPPQRRPHHKSPSRSRTRSPNMWTSPVHHPLSRRDRSFSPQRRPLRNSPSRSRTRSPNMWTSPRGRSDSGMNEGPRLRQRRSPNLRSEARLERMRSPAEARLERMRSPDRRPDFAEHIVGYASSSRNRTSLQQASGWIDERKELSDNFREHEYRRSSGRSPPTRVFSRSRRFDLMDSPGRLKPDEHYRSMHSGRFPEFDGAGRGSRHDGYGDDRRGHDDRYEMLHSVRQYDIDSDMKRFRCDVEVGFRAHRPRNRIAPEFQRRGSPRDFDSELGDSPLRGREEKCHFRYGRDGKHSSSYKSFGMQKCEDDMAPRRR